jgi:lambda family phage portal protein
VLWIPRQVLHELSVSLGQVPISVKASAAYEAGSAGTRRTVGWRAPTASPNSAILNNLSTLRDRSRSATRNDGYAKGSIDRLVSNIIGTGIKPLSQAKDPEFRRQVHALWLLWTDECDADGLLDLYGQQAQAVRAWLEGGEIFIRLRPRKLEDGLSVPLQVQVLEPELCPYTYNTRARNGNRIRAGIEFNGIGKRVAYWFHPSRPTDFNDFDTSELRRVPAESAIHLYDPLRPGQLRGVPHLTQALIRLYELDKFDDATLLRQQLANLFVAFLKRPQSIGEGESLHPLTGLPIETSGDQQVLSLEPGIFQELAPGEDITFSDPPEIRSGYADFTRQQLFHISAATGVPYETLTGDMSRVNDRTVRVILHEFRRRIQAWQHQIVAFQLCRPLWRAWLDRVFLSGAIEIPVDYVADQEPWSKVKWMPQGWPYLHPVQDVQAQKAAIRSGFTSRSAVVSEQGEDAEEIDREQAGDNDRADSLGLKYDSDARPQEVEVTT